MKKFLKIIFLLLITFSLLPIKTYAANDLLGNAKAGILMDYESGTILYEKNANERLSVASMTKMMGMILVMEALEDGSLRLDEKVKASKNAAGMGGSQIWLEEGEEITVLDLIKGIMMASANDGIVCMAERIGGTEKNFVSMMNSKAKELGLKNTNFVNPTGLDEDNHYSSAYDMALIAKELLKHEDILKYTSIYEDYLRKGTSREFWLVNTNKLIASYKGADGLKTGMTDNAGYCMAVTAKRNNMRLIAIVLGEKEGKVRNQETAELLDYGFNLYEVTTIKQKGEVLGTINIDKANLKEIEIVAGSDVTILKKKADKDKEYKTSVELNTLKLPISKGDTIGKLIVRDTNGNKIDEVSITINNDIKKDNFFNIFLKLLKSMIQGELF